MDVFYLATILHESSRQPLIINQDVQQRGHSIAEVKTLPIFSNSCLSVNTSTRCSFCIIYFTFCAHFESIIRYLLMGVKTIPPTLLLTINYSGILFATFITRRLIRLYLFLYRNHTQSHYSSFFPLLYLAVLRLRSPSFNRPSHVGWLPQDLILLKVSVWFKLEL